jgi:hypothetical protein
MQSDSEMFLAHTQGPGKGIPGLQTLRKVMGEYEDWDKRNRSREDIVTRHNEGS